MENTGRWRFGFRMGNIMAQRGVISHARHRVGIIRFLGRRRVFINGASVGGAPAFRRGAFPVRPDGRGGFCAPAIGAGRVAINANGLERVGRVLRDRRGGERP